MPNLDTKISIIHNECIELLNDSPEGKHFSELYNYIKNQHPDYAEGTISGSVRELATKNPEIIYKPDKGIYKHMRFQNIESNRNEPLNEEETINSTGRIILESDFYESFAHWIVNVLDECTKAIKLGGNRFRDKWGTPDVIGITKPKNSDIVKFQIEITSVEIKLSSNQIITGFGQACSYSLFSHKVYLVIPNKSWDIDGSRIDSLCSIFGIGLITFDSENPDVPNYEIKNRARRKDPDYFYTNKYLRDIEDELFN